MRADARVRSRTQLVLSCLIIFNEIFQDCYLKITGNLIVYQLPLHLCGLAVFITFAHSIILDIRARSEIGKSASAYRNACTGNRTEIVCENASDAGADSAERDGRKGRILRGADHFLGQVRFSLCLPGALLAILFPDWTCYPPLSFMCIFGFVNHILISGSALWLVLQRDFGIRPAYIADPAVFLFITVPIIYRFDRAENTNYFFLINGPEGSPLYWLQHTWPDNYLTAYAVLAAAVITLWYIVWSAAKKIRRM